MAYERRALHYAFTVSRDDDFIPFVNPGADFHQFECGFDMSRWGEGTQRRAPLVLAAAGCALTDPRAEEQWRGVFCPSRHGEGRPCA